jgi:dihydrofolate synthase/folylpolyglutamate synthase
VDRWYVATLQTPRTATGEEILGIFTSVGVNAPAQPYADIRAAYAAARRAAGSDDRILVFGSFYAVGDILAASSD